ncbi:MAG TPA: septum formation initiator family protein [Caulobacteraceae bacterium]|nr:septum formation initiator family protein [Caulobacteraceae bacterium]
MLARLTTFIPTVVLAALIFYFGFNALSGDRGLLTTKQREATLIEDEAQLKTLQAERMELEQRARLLSDGNLSRDLLEERAHVVLGFADPRDYVIRTPEPAR